MTKDIELPKSWPRHADMAAASEAIRIHFTHFHRKKRVLFSSLLARADELSIRSGQPLLQSFTDRRLSTLSVDIVNWISDVYRYRAFLPEDERLLMLHRRLDLLQVLYGILGWSIPPSMQQRTLASLHTPFLPTDVYFSVGDPTDMSYDVDPQISEREDKALERFSHAFVYPEHGLAPKTPAKPAPPAPPAMPAAPAKPAPSSDRRLVKGPGGTTFTVSASALPKRRHTGELCGLWFVLWLF